MQAESLVINKPGISRVDIPWMGDKYNIRLVNVACIILLKLNGTVEVNYIAELHVVEKNQTVFVDATKVILEGGDVLLDTIDPESIPTNYKVEVYSSVSKTTLVRQK